MLHLCIVKLKLMYFNLHSRNSGYMSLKFSTKNQKGLLYVKLSVGHRLTFSMDTILMTIFIMPFIHDSVTDEYFFKIFYKICSICFKFIKNIQKIFLRFIIYREVSNMFWWPDVKELKLYTLSKHAFFVWRGPRL